MVLVMMTPHFPVALAFAVAAVSLLAWARRLRLAQHSIDPASSSVHALQHSIKAACPPPTPAVCTAAEALLTRQSVLRGRVSKLLDSFPACGLYADEIDGVPNGDQSAVAAAFAAFVRHVQASLAVSPRTVLLHSLDKALAALYRSNADAAALHELLGVKPGCTIIQIAERFEALVPGKNHVRWVAADGAARKEVVDESEMIARVAAGMRTKAAARGAPPPSEEEVAATVARSQLAAEERRERAGRRAAALRAEVERDPEYVRWARAQALWAASRVRELWVGYVAVDRSEGEERRQRGGTLDSRC
jgi:hypothetical protein